jgi:glycosyltransferase involved in cell wall biosynthesis
VNLAFFVPPPAQRVGGLDLAVSELARALDREGWRIQIDPANLTGYDVVHLHGLWQRRFVRIALECRNLSIPYVASPHGMLEPWAWGHRRWKKLPYFHLIEKRILNGSKRILATSQLEADNLLKFKFRSPIVTLPLGLDAKVGPAYETARSRLGWSDQAFVLLYLSRVHPKKGLHLLLEALADLDLSQANCSLVVVGDGPEDYVHKVKAFAKTEAARLPSIHWVGSIWDDRKWDYLQGADLFCLPTQSENFGLAILESCQVGTPVLTTIGTPWVEFLSRHGLPVIAPDEPALREALAQLISQRGFNPIAREQLASDSRQQFGWSNLGPRYAQFYRDLVAEEH